MKKSKNNNDRYIPRKNYFYVAFIVIFILLLCWYFISWHNVKKTDLYGKSYLIDTNTLALEVTNLKEITNILNETPSEYFVLISYTNDEDVYNLEKDLKDIIDGYGIKDEMYYINVTNIKDNKSLYQDLNNTFNTTKIKNIPCILYYTNNSLEKIIGNNKGVFKAKDFESFLKSKNYDKISE